MSLESASSRLIAVTFSGWLNVTIPDAGRDARRFLVEPLGADVLICADTCTPEPYCTYGLCVAASRVPCVPRRRAAWTGSATHCTYAVRVPAWDACCTYRVPWAPQVFVAGTFLPTDCAAARDGRCLLERLRHLQPLAAVDLAPMLTHEQLVSHARGAPAFGPISRDLKVSQSVSHSLPHS